MKPYVFFCYVTKYFAKLEQLEHNPTPEREEQVKRLRSTIEAEIERVKVVLQRKNTTFNY